MQLIWLHVYDGIQLLQISSPQWNGQNLDSRTLDSLCLWQVYILRSNSGELPRFIQIDFDGNVATALRLQADMSELLVKDGSFGDAISL